jgi:hypothetical protein
MLKKKNEQGGSPQFPGVLVGPLPVRKCHQMPSKEHMQLGWASSVGSLAHPRATPRLGGAAVSCQYFPCSFVLALRELGLRLGVKAPPRHPHIRSKTEPRSTPLHVFDRGEYQVTIAHFARGFRTPGLCLSSSSCLSGCSKPDPLFGCLSIAPHACLEVRRGHGT